jgi:intracellular multiplication protein IcmW
MVDLTHAGIHKFWNSFPDKTIYRVIACMEGMEHWTADGDPQVEAAITKLGNTMDSIDNVDIKQEDNIINLGAHLKAGRNLRILMGMDQAFPGSAAKVLMHAEKITKSNKDTAGLFLRRNLIFERLRLSSRLFANERIKLVQKCLEGGDED